ncbi:MAG: type 1 glutamine amidotransferase domain-containing protein [Wenzhouxiangellaceae bacterium]|nr:type 1 glutamine amidotransferase domain-containing protein [Wenzhouxiangellaceae bacterium]
MKILMVLTSHDRLGNSGEKTGFWLEEFAAPYYAFVDAGAEVALASPKGGQPPLDPKSDEPDQQTAATRRFGEDEKAQRALANTLPLAEIDPGAFDAVFYPGGHGPLWDLAGDPRSIEIIRAMLESNRPVAAVCHAPAVLTEVKGRDGGYVVAGRRVTGFTNTEEDAVGLTDTVPFLVEDRLKQRGGQFRRGDDWASHVEVDGLLVTGQNPASSAAAAEAVIDLVRRRGDCP